MLWSQCERSMGLTQGERGMLGETMTDLKGSDESHGGANKLWLGMGRSWARSILSLIWLPLAPLAWPDVLRNKRQEGRWGMAPWPCGYLGNSTDRCGYWGREKLSDHFNWWNKHYWINSIDCSFYSTGPSRKPDTEGKNPVTIPAN